VVAQVAERVWSAVIPHQAAAAGGARARLSAQLTRAVPAEMLADVVSIAAELVSNAIRHATPLPGGVIRLVWRLRHTAGKHIVEVRVTDGGGVTRPHVHLAGLDATEGRGLAIVEALSTAWGVEQGQSEQTVWAEICRSR